MPTNTRKRKRNTDTNSFPRCLDCGHVPVFYTQISSAIVHCSICANISSNENVPLPGINQPSSLSLLDLQLDENMITDIHSQQKSEGPDRDKKMLFCDDFLAKSARNPCPCGYVRWTRFGDFLSKMIHHIVISNTVDLYFKCRNVEFRSCKYRRYKRKRKIRHLFYYFWK